MSKATGMDAIFPINPAWPRVKFNSTLLSEAAYDPKEQKMYVYFDTNHSLYSYTPVSEKKFLDMQEAPSSGSYFVKNFKKNKSIQCKPVRKNG